MSFDGSGSIDPDGDGLLYAWDFTSDGSTDASTAAQTSNTYTAVGTYTATLTVTDTHGVATTDTATVQATYPFTGFLQPVDNTPTFNKVNAGRAIPVKFSLSGNRGTGILAANSPASAVTVCNSSAPVDPVEQTLTAGNSSLSYDPATDTYTYVWKTDKAWAAPAGN